MLQYNKLSKFINTEILFSVLLIIIVLALVPGSSRSASGGHSPYLPTKDSGSEYMIGNIDVTFGPHGVTFKKPAHLYITLENADLSDIDSSSLGVYYVNEDTGELEQMRCRAIKVDKSNGKLEVVKAKIPHFSRFAVAFGN